MSDTPVQDLSSGTIAFRVTGRVQGVYFRVFGRGVATEEGVKGWIRNEADGSVTGVASGSAGVLERFLERLRQGPPAGRVDELTWEPVESDEIPASFEIRY